MRQEGIVSCNGKYASTSKGMLSGKLPTVSAFVEKPSLIFPLPQTGKKHHSFVSQTHPKDSAIQLASHRQPRVYAATMNNWRVGLLYLLGYCKRSCSVSPFCSVPASLCAFCYSLVIITKNVL